jgi:hypothetical protein
MNKLEKLEQDVKDAKKAAKKAAWDAAQTAYAADASYNAASDIARGASEVAEYTYDAFELAKKALKEYLEGQANE